jgi:hypothetical protein
MQGLDWQTWRMAFVAGLNQKLSTREIEPPSLTIAKDCQFDKTGDLQTRYPYSSLGTDILGGGSLSNVRRGVENGDEKLLFTKDTLYSWNPQYSKWVSKGTHLAVKVSEKNVCVTGGEQVEVDRAELSNVVVFAWTEYTASATSDVYVSAYDKTTGSPILAPTSVSGSDDQNLPRLVALDSYILLFVNNVTTGRLNAKKIDPTDVSTSVAAAFSVVAGTAHSTYYDVAKVPSSAAVVLAHKLSPTTTYGLAHIPESLSGMTTTTVARTCDGLIAVACAPNGTHFQVARVDTNAVEGDYIAISGLADVYVNQTIGPATAGCNQITAAYRSVTDGGYYRCYIFWSSGATIDPSGAWYSQQEWVNTNNVLGALGSAAFVRRLDVGSRAFDHEGRVYVWMNWGVGAGSGGTDGKLQNAAYLYRDDATLVAKTAWNRGYGHLKIGHLPNVASTGTSTFSYAATDRAVFGELASSNFSGSRPLDVTFVFDSNEARRCARLGRTLYVACGEGLLQYDGVRLMEVGFHMWPSYTVLTSASGGSLDNGVYAYKCSYVSSNAQAEIDRSASISVEEVTVSSGPKRVEVSAMLPLYVTHKPTLACEVWRTKKNPNVDDSYYKASTSDPSDRTNPQRYLPNDTSGNTLATMNDDYSDASISVLGTHPQDNTLPSLAPPPATIIIATDSRIYLAGVAGDPHSVWYSKQRAEGEVAAFHGNLKAPVPAAGGDITALAFLSETLVVFRENAIYVMPGDGYDNTGGGANLASRALSVDIGAVNQESVCVTDSGIVFKSSKGWYRLNRSFSLDYIGAGVMDYDTETPLAVHLVESQHQLRILSASRMLVLDTLGGQWFEWTISDGAHACMWQGTHAYLTSSAPKTQQTTYTAATYGMDIETAWIDLSKMAAFGRVRRIEVRGEYRAAHSMRIRLARDFWVDGVDTYFDDDTWTVSPTTVGGPLEVEHGPAIQQVNAIKVRITVTPTTVGESCKLSALSFELGFKKGLFRRLPAAQRQ